MPRKVNVTEFFRCFDNDSNNCDDLNLSLDPDLAHDAKRAKTNAVFREIGTSKNPDLTDPDFFYDLDNFDRFKTRRRSGNEVKRPGNFSLGLNSFNARGEFDFQADAPEFPLVDDTPETIVPNALERQRANDRAVIIEKAHKSFPYISPLASTNITGLEPIVPYSDSNHGKEGTVYNPKLLDDEGIIYLRQYLSFDDEATGAVWRFQYAPQIGYSRASTFQEDVTWGTNVQPSHFNNTSGKKIVIQGAILEGMTVGKTVTSAVKALETLMSVIAPDEKMQIAPYAYRLIVGSRTFTEPVSGRHAPFVIENLQVREEMYDSSGEVLMYKIDLSLKEVPYYQINNGRKLLLVSQNQRTVAQKSCDRISAELAELDNVVAEREQNLNNILTDVQNGGGGKDKLSRQKMKTRLPDINSNCQQDSAAYSEYIELFKRYKEEKCRTSKPIRGFQIIEELFANNSGIYEILKGRPQLAEPGIFKTGVFNEDGVVVPYSQVAKTIEQRVGSTNPPYSFLSTVNDGFGDDLDRRIDNLPLIKVDRTDFKDLLKTCPHIRCFSSKVGSTISEENIRYLMSAATNILDDKNDFSNNYDITGARVVLDNDFLKSIFSKYKGKSGKNLKYKTLSKGDNNFLCSDIGFGRASLFGYSNSGGVVKRTKKKADEIFNKGITESAKYRIPSVQAAVCTIHIKAILENYLEVSKEKKCNTDASAYSVIELYSKYVAWLEGIYNKIIEESKKIKMIQEELLKTLASDTPCANYLPQRNLVESVVNLFYPDNYDERQYGICRAAFSVVKNAKYTIKTLGDVGTIDDPFFKIKLSPSAK